MHTVISAIVAIALPVGGFFWISHLMKKTDEMINSISVKIEETQENHLKNYNAEFLRRCYEKQAKYQAIPKEEKLR